MGGYDGDDVRGSYGQEPQRDLRVRCEKCGASGRVLDPIGDDVRCETCKGHGFLMAARCTNCDGKGHVSPRALP